MKKFLSVWIIMVGLVLIGYYFIPPMVESREPVSIREIPITMPSATFPPSPTAEPPGATQISEAVTVEVVEVLPTPTATPEAPISGYSIDGRVDLANGVPTAMRIYLLNGEVIVSTWAQPFGFTGDNEQAQALFDPFNGTIFSYQDEVLGTWIHSGFISSGQLFAQGIQVYVLGTKGHLKTMAEGQAALDNLNGATVVFCQAPDMKIFSEFASDTPCPGIEVSFTLVAKTFVMRESVEEYEASINKLVTWLKSDYPGKGFESVNPGTGHVLLTCIGQFYDQPRSEGDDTKSYLFNRLVLGLEYKEP